MGTAQRLIRAAVELRAAVERLAFAPPVTHVYDPLVYAWAPYRQYLLKWGNSRKRAVFLGMNPGPWGMAQVGVPFGEVGFVRDWVGIAAHVGKPAREHPKRPVDGFACQRSEVSGTRLWGYFAKRFGKPAAFFRTHFVANYCPLMFIEASGRNRTPDKLPAAEQVPLLESCDAHLRAVVCILEPEWVIGIGGFAAAQAQRALASRNVKVAGVLHPSPANPTANRGWAPAVEKQLIRLGVW
jgi:single-strand selective monofunctional uracil DNA glycosylase